MQTAKLREHPSSNLVPDMRAEEWVAFLADVKERGIVVPLDVLADGTILDGRHRYRAARELGIEELFVRVVSPANPDAYMVKAAVLRRHLTDDQRAILANEWQKRASTEAQHEAAKVARATQLGVSVNASETPPRDTRTEAATMFGVSERKVRYAKQVANGAPDLLAAIQSGDLPLVKAVQEVARRREPVPIETPSLPSGKYRCIVIDPPWPMQKIEREVRPQQGKGLDYPVMSLEEIAELPIPSLFDDEGCHIYLWVTHKYLPEGLKFFERWGVKYQCVLTWVKNVGFTPFSFMYSTEHVIFGRVGSLKLLRMGARLDFGAPVSGHSVKPEVFYELVRSVSPDPRLEMFARQPHEGFTSWGQDATMASR